MPAGSPQPANPIVKLAVAGAGTLAALVANQVLEKGWSAVFGEDAPTEKASKQSAKEVKAQRKKAKKEGKSAEEIDEIDDPLDDVDLWKVILWTILSGVAIQGLRLLAERGTQKGAERLVSRRPRANRG